MSGEIDGERVMADRQCSGQEPSCTVPNTIPYGSIEYLISLRGQWTAVAIVAVEKRRK